MTLQTLNPGGGEGAAAGWVQALLGTDPSAEACVRTCTCALLCAHGRCSHEAAHCRYREAELKHGRVAMLAAWGMITQDMWHPLFNGKLSANPLLAIVQVCS